MINDKVSNALTLTKLLKTRDAHDMSSYTHIAAQFVVLQKLVTKYMATPTKLVLSEKFLSTD